MSIIDLPEPVRFEWDAGNINKNKIKHNVDFLEAQQVFLNTPLWAVPDEKHSNEKEKRYNVLGHTDSGKELFISFTIRNEAVRVISARVMNKYERLFYEKVKRNS
ncbi:MAG: BrnT family toxin [Ignavibacteriaceae bacterium]